MDKKRKDRPTGARRAELKAAFDRASTQVGSAEKRKRRGPGAFQLDRETLVRAPLGRYGEIAYVRHEVMFEGTTSEGHRYRVPSEIITPAKIPQGCGMFLLDWLNRTAIFTALGREFGFGRFILSDELLFEQGIVYAAVRSDPIAIGKPWLDTTFDTASEFIQVEADEFEMIADFAAALQSDPLATEIVGPIRRKAAFGYSASGSRLRGILRIGLGRGVFDYSLVGGAGDGFSFPNGDIVDDTEQETPPLEQAGLEIDFNTETEILVFGGENARAERPNYRDYELAGAAHLNRTEAVIAGFPDPEKANPCNWFPMVRALFAAAGRWHDGIEPPPSLWLGAPQDALITRDAKGNAPVRFVGGRFVETDRYRLPEVAVGENQYIAYDPSYDLLRAIAGSAVDLTATFPSHEAYVERIADHAELLRQQGYLLATDVALLEYVAVNSPIGRTTGASYR
jgi:hypothetical protein